MVSMKTHTLTLSEAHFVGVSPETATEYCIYEAERGDGWGPPWGGFLIGRIGWKGGGSLPGMVAQSRGDALFAWRAAIQKPVFKD